MIVVVVILAFVVIVIAVRIVMMMVMMPQIVMVMVDQVICPGSPRVSAWVKFRSHHSFFRLRFSY